MQLPRSGKRCAEPATAATAKAEMEVFGGGDGAPHKRVKPLPPPPQAFRSVIGLFFFPPRVALLLFRLRRRALRLKATVCFRFCACLVSRGSYGSCETEGGAVKSERPHCHSRAKNLVKLCHVVSVRCCIGIIQFMMHRLADTKLDEISS